MGHQALRSPPWMTSMVHLRLSTTTALRPKLQGREQWLWPQDPLSGDGAQLSVICPSSRARVRDKKAKTSSCLENVLAAFLVYIYIYIWFFFFFCLFSLAIFSYFFLFSLYMNELYFIMSSYFVLWLNHHCQLCSDKVFFSPFWIFHHNWTVNCLSVSDICPVLPSLIWKHYKRMCKVHLINQWYIGKSVLM